MSNSEQVDNKNATETAAFLEIPPAQKQNAQTEPPELEKQESVKKLPPDGGYGWVVLVASFSISFILDAIMYSFGILLTAIKEHYEVSNKTANLLTSLYTGCFLLCGPLVSGLIKQFGCRVTIICGAAVTSLMFFVSIFAPNIYVMYITIGVIGGSATGVFYISALLIIPEYFDKYLGIATGVTMAGSGIGFFIGPPIISKLISNFGWKVTLSTCAALLLCNSFIGIFSKPLNPPKTKISFKKKKKPAVVESINVDVMSGSIVSLKHKSTDDEDESFIVGLFKEMINFKLLGSNWRFLFMTLSNLCIFIGYFLPFIFVTKIAESNNIENPSLVISVIGIVNIPGRILFGLFADKGFLSSTNLNTIACLIGCFPLLAYEQLLQQKFWTQCVFASLYALSTSGLVTLTTPYLKDIVGEEKLTNAMGIVSLFRGFGCFTGPFIGGIIADKWSMVTAFYFCGGCYVLGFIFSAVVSLKPPPKISKNVPTDLVIT